MMRARIGFVHEFRPLNATEMRRLLAKGFDDGGSDAPAASGDKSAFVLQCLIYRFECLRSGKLDGLWSWS